MDGVTQDTQERLRVADVARRLKAKPDTVRKWIARGKLTAGQDSTGQWLIPWPQDILSGGERKDSGQKGHLSALQVSSVLQAKVELLERELADRTAERDHWRETAAQALQVVDQQQRLALPGAAKAIAEHSSASEQCERREIGRAACRGRV